MLYLASSSPSRAALLKEAGIAFVQKICEYDEDVDKTLPPSVFVQRVVLEKERQFGQEFADLAGECLLFADSIVSLEGKILTKPHDDAEALASLEAQSSKSVSVLSAFLLSCPQKRIFSLSKTTLFFGEFDPGDLRDYIQSGEYLGKAGALMCEGFHQKYCLKMVGKRSTALGLDVENLKAYL